MVPPFGLTQDVVATARYDFEYAAARGRVLEAKPLAVVASSRASLASTVASMSRVGSAGAGAAVQANTISTTTASDMEVRQRMAVALASRVMKTASHRLL